MVAVLVLADVAEAVLTIPDVGDVRAAQLELRGANDTEKGILILGKDHRP